MRTVVTVVVVLAAIGAAPGAASAQPEPGTCDLDPELIIFNEDDFEVVQCVALAAGCPTITQPTSSTTTCTFGPVVCTVDEESGPRSGSGGYDCMVDARGASAVCGHRGAFSGSSDTRSGHDAIGCTFNARRIGVTAECREEEFSGGTLDVNSQGCFVGPASVECTQTRDFGMVISDVCVIAVGDPEDPRVVCTIDRQAPEASSCTRP